MRIWHFDGLWNGTRWLEPGIVRLDDHGKLLDLSEIAPTPLPASTRVERVRGYALPGFRNAHSHAFQYAMAGTAEYLRAGQDDFWSWREAMYALALSVTPDDVESIATMLYAEMLRHGFTAVAEFHYLHHDQHGEPYSNHAEMSERLVRAADRAGIAICLVPMYYRLGDFGQAANPRQRRFLSESPDNYARLLEAVRSAVKRYDRANNGVGVHSLRAASGEDAQAVFSMAKAGEPKHIHVAEQRKEVEACLKATGRRPVRWLLDEIGLDETYHLVHATHMTDEETCDFAQSGAHAVICPTTEGNLGDGFFNLATFREHGGRWSIGTDSHVGLSPLEELRLLDYGQRLRAERRNVICREAGDDSGQLLVNESLAGGRAALGETIGTWNPGEAFDAVIARTDFPPLASAPPERRIGIMLYAGDPSMWLGTITGGSWAVRDGQHRDRESITNSFSETMKSLRAKQ